MLCHIFLEFFFFFVKYFVTLEFLEIKRTLLFKVVCENPITITDYFKPMVGYPITSQL
jgi:hypothetical protein